MFHPNGSVDARFGSARGLRILEPGIVLMVISTFGCVVQVPLATGVDSSLAANVVRSATEMNWRQNPTSPITTGKNSVTLDPCPVGVIASEPSYYVHISGIDLSEAVHVIGGTCKGDGHPGTLEFRTRNTYGPGYVVESASGGIQEASVAARFTPTNPQGLSQSGHVVIPPGEYDVFAPISIRASGQTVDFQGAVLNCHTLEDACIFVGDHTASNAFEHISLIGPRGRPMTFGGTKPFIEVNAQQTRIFNVSTRLALRGAGFGSYVQVDDDQAFLLDGLDTTVGGRTVTCNSTFCGAVITAPGPFNRWSAVGWLRNMNISLQCAAKGVEWLSGNGLKISDSVIQGWSMFGIRAGNLHGGYGGLIIDNVYFEASPSCEDSNPLGNVGNTAILAEGVHVKISGLANNGASGVYPNWGAKSGSHQWLYWVVPVHSQFGDGIPLPAGYAFTEGAGIVRGKFPRIPGAASYKILKIDWNQKPPRPFPEGTGKYWSTTVEQSSCGPLTCQFMDKGGPLQPYATPAENFSTNIYMPRLDFWPGAIVVSGGADMSTSAYHDLTPILQSDVLGAGAIVSTIPAGAITGQAHSLIMTAATPPAAANLEALQTNGSEPPGATILKAANGTQTAEDGLKGRLNFGHGGRNVGFTPLITLGDSNWGKTWATANHRPNSDLKDLDLGYERNIGTLYSRAENEIRDYIGKFPDGKPQEELSSSAKTFNVPVRINGDLVVSGKCVGCTGSSIGGAPRFTVSLVAQNSSIPIRSLCAPSLCAVGQYRVGYYLDSTSTCSSAGDASTSLILSWKDETATRSFKLPLAGVGVSAGSTLGVGATSNFGTGEVFVWLAADAIMYSTAYMPCKSGAGTYSLRIVAEKLQ